MFTRHLPVLLAGALLLATPVANAQQRDAQARSMVRQAIEDYQNLEVDSALNRLRLAQNLCGRNNCSPAMLARVHVSIGVVTIGGRNDNAAGVEAFAAALRLDPAAEPDQMLVTPEITAAFAQARQQISGGATSGQGTTGSTGTGSGSTGTGSTGTGSTGTGTGSSGGTHPTTGESGSEATGGASGGLLHTPVPEQLENTPVPVYIEHGSLQPARVVVHYRGLGMSRFADVDMTRVANGYGVEIPCGQVIQPHVEYYVTALDSSGTTLGSVGSAESPTRITIVRTRTQPAPALPGRMPAEQCAEDCPPGMSGPQCGRGQRQMGDPCENDSQCGGGLHCDAGSCATGEANSSRPPSTNTYRFAFDVGGGLGLAYLSGNPREVTPGSLGTRYAEGEYVQENPGDPESSRLILPDNAPCNTSMPQLKCPNITSPGFAPAGYIYGAIRVNPFTTGILSRFGFGVSARFQFDASKNGILPNFFFGGRAYFAVTDNGWTRNGLVGAVFLGSGVGQMQARPGLSSGQGETAHLISGLNNVHAGGRIEYGFGDIGHIGADVTMNFQLPNFLFVIDVQAVAGLHF